MRDVCACVCVRMCVVGGNNTMWEIRGSFLLGNGVSEEGGEIPSEADTRGDAGVK